VNKKKREKKKKVKCKNLSQALTQGRVGMLKASVAMETCSVVSISPLRLSRAESLEAR
jgi:hypothetical protein